MADWLRMDQILQSADRTIGDSGVAIAHTIATPDMIELELLLLDARYESEGWILSADTGLLRSREAAEGES